MGAAASATHGTARHVGDLEREAGSHGGAPGLGSCDMWEGDGGLPEALPFLGLKHDVNYIVLSTGQSE